MSSHKIEFVNLAIVLQEFMEIKYSTNNRLLTFLLCCMSLTLTAQQQVPVADSTSQDLFKTPYDPKAGFRTWSTKGKVLPYPIFGNGAGISVLLGLEYGFTKNQSIGVDVFSDWSENSNDHATDTAGVQHAYGDNYTGGEQAIFLNYR